MTTTTTTAVCDALILAGMLAIIHGAAMMHPAAPWVIGGAFAAAIGIGASRVTRRKPKRKGQRA